MVLYFVGHVRLKWPEHIYLISDGCLLGTLLLGNPKMKLRVILYAG